MSFYRGVDAFCIEHGLDREDRRAMRGLLKQAKLVYRNGVWQEEGGAAGNAPGGNQGPVTTGGTPGITPGGGTPAPVAPVVPGTQSQTQATQGAVDPNAEPVVPQLPAGTRFMSDPLGFIKNWYNNLGDPEVAEQKRKENNPEYRAWEMRQNRNAQAATAAKMLAKDKTDRGRMRFVADRGGEDKAQALAAPTKPPIEKPPEEIKAHLDAIAKGDYSFAQTPAIATLMQEYQGRLSDPNISPADKERITAQLNDAVTRNWQRGDIKEKVRHEYTVGGGRRAARALLRQTPFFGDREFMSSPGVSEYVNRQPAPLPRSQAYSKQGPRTGPVDWSKFNTPQAAASGVPAAKQPAPQPVPATPAPQAPQPQQQAEQTTRNPAPVIPPMPKVV